MNQLYLHVVIFNKAVKTTAFILFLASFSMFFNALPAKADQGYDIKAHYYLPITENKGKYYDVVSWDINNSNGWINFVNNVQTLPRIMDVTNPLESNLPDMIYINQINPDKLSGNEMYMSKDGIHLISKMPFDMYYYTNSGLKEFLDRELDKNAAYAQKQENIDIKSPGIVVTYNGSNTLENPIWRVSADEDVEQYKIFIDSLVPIDRKTKFRIQESNTDYDSLGSFVMYLNYDGAPAETISVSTGGEVRGTKFDIVKYMFQDTKGYYEIYKKRANDIVRGNEARRKGESLNNENNRF